MLGAVVAVYSSLLIPDIDVNLLLGVLFFIVVFFIISYLWSFAQKKSDQINKNTKKIEEIKEDINSLKDKLNLHKDIAILNSRVDSIEKN